MHKTTSLVCERQSAEIKPKNSFVRHMDKIPLGVSKEVSVRWMRQEIAWDGGTVLHSSFENSEEATVEEKKKQECFEQELNCQQPS